MVFMNSRSAEFNGIVPDMVTMNIDEEYGGWLAGEYLKNRSCREFSIVYSSADPFSQMRRKGFIRSLEEAGKVCHSFDFPHLAENYSQFLKRSRTILDEFYETSVHWNPMPHGIFFTSYLPANLLMDDLRFRGLKDGDQIHAVGFYGNTDLHYPSYYYAKIVIPFYEIGNTAMKMLVQILNGKNTASHMFKPSLVFDYCF